jgi:PAS domain S-box-containing protein
VRLFAGMSYDDLLNRGLAVGDYPDAEGREEAWLATHHALRDCGESLAQRTRDGRWLRISERRTADGGTIRSCIDITELKRAEADLIAARDEANEAARRADEAEAIAGLGHWRLDVGTLAMDWSAELYRIYGLEPGSPLDFDAITSMTHHDDARTMLERLQRQMRDGDADQNSITRIVSATGELRYLLGNSRGAFGPDGKVTAVIGTAVDVTDQKQLEARMAAAKAEAEAAAQVKAEFLANMSHELRTPLTSIIGFTGLAADQPTLPPLARTYIERVRDASQALLCTVNDILDFSKLEAGQVAIHPAPVDLRALCEATLDLFAPQAGAKDIRLVLDSADLDRRVLMLDADRIRQVLLNLIGNAVKFAATGSVTLRLRYDASSEALTLDVIDTGPGIAPDKHAALFKRFSQIDGSTSRAAGGTGLGLAICKGLVEAMGGRIGLESREGEGARFWIELRSPAAAQLDVAAAAPAMQAPEEGLRVLVVDDHPANRELARLYLAAVGAEVTEAASGADALRLAAAAPFDVILLDLRMPGIDGLEVLRRLRAEGGVNDNTPVLAYTADAGDGVFAKLHQLGFVGVVGKPVAPADLIRKVSAAVAATAMDERDAA